MSKRYSVLFVLSSHSQLGNTGKPIGWFLPEFAHPYYQLESYVRVAVASPAGGEAPLDAGSVEMFKEDKESMQFLKEQESLWKQTEKLSSFVGRAKDFDAIFVVGGHGPMFDLATDPTSHQVVREFWEAGKIVSGVCHGSAALLNVKLADGSYLLEGSQVTGFSNSEEESMKLASAMPFMLETELDKQSGGNFVKTEDWGVKVAIGKEGRLITGQNPASASAVGKAINERLGKA